MRNLAQCSLANSNRLDRHMARHKEKDDEAGGEGLGVLATRKRLLRDSNGAIVNARRPSYTPEGPASKRRAIADVKKRAPRPAVLDQRKMSRNQRLVIEQPQHALPMSGDASRDISRASSTIIVDPGQQQQQQQHHQSFEYPDPEEDRKAACSSWLEIDNTLPSPPLSSPSLHSNAQSPSHSLTELDALYEDASWPLHSPLNAHQDLLPSPHQQDMRGDEQGFTGFSQAPFQTFMGAMETLPYDDIFKPEAGVWDWQQWNSQVLMSRCREERYEPKYEVGEGREWLQAAADRRFIVGA